MATTYTADSYEYAGYNSPDGVVVASGTAEKVGFYGTAPAAQRSAAAQATSLVGTASATAVTTDVKAALIEVMNTLAALGIWKGSA